MALRPPRCAHRKRCLLDNSGVERAESGECFLYSIFFLNSLFLFSRRDTWSSGHFYLPSFFLSLSLASCLSFFSSSISFFFFFGIVQGETCAHCVFDSCTGSCRLRCLFSVSLFLGSACQLIQGKKSHERHFLLMTVRKKI